MNLAMVTSPSIVWNMKAPWCTGKVYPKWTKLFVLGCNTVDEEIGYPTYIVLDPGGCVQRISVTRLREI